MTIQVLLRTYESFLIGAALKKQVLSYLKLGKIEILRQLEEYSRIYF